MKNAVSFLVEKTSQNVKTAVARTRTQVILYAVLGVCAFMLLMFLCFAVFFSLTVYTTPLKASWIVAGFWLLLCLAIWGTVRYLAQKQKKTAILPTMPKEQKELMASSALSALFWVARRSPVLKYAGSFVVIGGLLQVIKGINDHGVRAPRNPSNFH